ncbi:MAG: S8 family serine peptidase [Phycisphaerae bacterium]|jgi:hypothetical protein
MSFGARCFGLACVLMPGVFEVAAGAADPAVPTWVFFQPRAVEADPVALQAALRRAEASADARMLERRRLRRTAPGLVDARDLPLDEGPRAAVASLASVRVESRWLNALSVEATPEQAAAIRSLPGVREVRPVARGRRCGSADACEEPVPEDASHHVPRDFYGRSSSQLSQINLQALHARGYTGAGVVIGILDTGFNRVHEGFNNPAHPLRVIAERDFINADGQTGPEAGDPSGQHVHGTLILGCIASYLPDRMVGGAFDASVILCKTENVASETPVEEDYYAAGIEFIENRGGDVATSSLGYIDWYTRADLDGRTAVTTVAVNIAAENGLHCCTAAGNEGHDADPATASIIAPADGLRVISCGAADATGVIAGFSSDGPTADGRLKPELLARGVGTATVHPDTVDTYASASGTSLSTPLVAAAVACLVQANPWWTVDQMRAALCSTASDAAHPDGLFVRGYGMVDAFAAFQSACPADFNQDGGVDGVDVGAFFVSWEAAETAADVNHDGGVDGSDIETFFRVWQAGGC